MRVAGFLVLIVYALYARAQEPAQVQYTSATGLPSNTIYDIYRDSKGYLWFGTDNGIARYNGVHFDTYSTIDGLPDNEIFFFKEDYYGRLWMSTFNGALCYYQDGTFYTAANTDFLKMPFQASDTRFITAHTDSSISVYFMNLDYFLNIKNDKIKVIDISALNVKQSLVQGIVKQSPGVYDVFLTGKKVRVNDKGTILRSDPYKKGQNYFVSYTQDSVYLFDGHAIYNLEQQVVYKFSERKNREIIRVYLTENTAFLGTRNGLLLNGKMLLANTRVSSVTQDPDGNYWIGTLDNGAYKLKRNYQQYLFCEQAYEGTVTCSYDNGNDISFATSTNKLYRIASGASCSAVLVDSLPIQRASLQYLDSNVFYAYDGYRLAAVGSGGNKKAEHYVYDYEMKYLPKVLIVSDSVAYFQGFDEICFAKYGKGKLQHLSDTPGTRVYYMEKDADGRIWYTTRDMYLISGSHPILQSQFEGLSFKWFRFLGRDILGVTQNGRLVTARLSQGGEVVYTVVQDKCKWGNAYRIDNNRVLISTDDLYRLMTIHGSNTDTVHYSIKPVENEFIPKDVEYITSDGTTVYFFQSGNIYTCPVKELFGRPAAPVIVNVLFKTNKQSYNSRKYIYISHAEAKNILVSSDMRSYDSKNISYQYAVSRDGEDEWNTTKNPDMNLVIPGYGDYQVKIRAVTRSGIKSDTYVLNVTIVKPFYLQLWFFVLAFISVGVLVFLAVRRRLHYLLGKKENEYALKMKVVRSEYKALNALMNPHFIFNSLNSIQGFINRGNKTSANRYLDHFSRLMRQNMHNVSRDLVSVDEEIALLNDYLLLEKMRFNDRFEYFIDIQLGIDEADIFIPPLLIQPLVENAIKHGLLPGTSGSNKLWVRLRLSGSILVIEVEDNGIGFPSYNQQTSSGSHKSYSLNNINARIARLNELYRNVISMDITSGVANTGTKVSIEIDVDSISTNSKDRY